MEIINCCDCYSVSSVNFVCDFSVFAGPRCVLTDKVTSIIIDGANVLSRSYELPNETTTLQGDLLTKGFSSTFVSDCSGTLIGLTGLSQSAISVSLESLGTFPFSAIARYPDTGETKIGIYHLISYDDGSFKFVGKPPQNTDIIGSNDGSKVDFMYEKVDCELQSTSCREITDAAVLALSAGETVCYDFGGLPVDSASVGITGSISPFIPVMITTDATVSDGNRTQFVPNEGSLNFSYENNINVTEICVTNTFNCPISAIVNGIRTINLSNEGVMLP